MRTYRAVTTSEFWPFRVLLGAAVAGPTALFAIGAWQSHTQLYEAAETTAQRQATAFAEHAAETLQSVELVIEQVNQRLYGLSWDEIRTSRPLWEELSRLDKQVPEVDAIFAVDPKGMNALTTRAFPPPPVDFSQRDYFKAQLHAGAGTYLGAFTVGLISHHPIFNMSVRRRSPTGTFDGVVGVSISDYFEKFYDRDVLPQNFAVALVHNGGQILAQYPPEPVAHADPIPPSPSGWFFDSGHGAGGERIVAFQRLSRYPAYLTVSVADASIRDAWFGYLAQWGALAVASAIALVSFALLALRRMRREAVAVARQQETYVTLIAEEQRRKHAEAALVETRKLEALGQLTGGVAHDFNNLLQALGGNLGIARSRATDERARRALDGCQQTVERGKALIHKLLAFARRQPLKYEVFDVNARLEGLCELLRQSAPLIDLKIVPAPDLWPAESDPGQFDLAILNLVVNARDAMGDGGIVSIETSNVTLNGAAGELNGSFVAIKVSDNGPGIPAEVLQRIWEPFFTTKPVGKGTGLGLSIVYGFARQSGGGVSVDSDLGRGTTFRIYLPKGAPVQGYGDATMAGSAGSPPDDARMVMKAIRRSG